MNLKPPKTTVHFFKFMVNCFFFLIFTRFAYHNDFFILIESRSSQFTFGSDCTVLVPCTVTCFDNARVSSATAPCTLSKIMDPKSKWDVFTKFRAKLPAGRTDWRAFQLAFILYGHGWSSTSKVWRTFVEGKKGNYALSSLLGLPWVLHKNGFMQI